jgi:hypothetical protein
MDFLEKDLEEIIYLSDKNLLSDRGLYLHGKLKRQVRIGNYGVADLINVEKPLYSKGFGFHSKDHFKGLIEVVELKKDKIGVSTFFQALNYIKGIQQYLGKRNKDYLFNYQITLIGKEVDLNSSFCYLSDVFCEDMDMISVNDSSKIAVNLYTYKYGLDGLNFESISGYSLNNEGF